MRTHRRVVAPERPNLCAQDGVDGLGRSSGDVEAAVVEADLLRADGGEHEEVG
jgi:hypothetical protein